MPYNGVTGVITPVSGVITIFITARCQYCMFFCYVIGTDQNLNSTDAMRYIWPLALALSPWQAPQSTHWMYPAETG